MFLYIVPNLKIQRSNGVRDLFYAHTSRKYDMPINVLVMCHVRRTVTSTLPLYFLALFGVPFSHDEGICFTSVFNLVVELIVTAS